jgi:iron complex transport system ATP-binding protein
VGHVALRGLRLVAGERTVLDGVSIDALPGELVAIVGPNGAGKTTLLRAIAGFAAPARGDVLLDGIPVRSLSARERARAVTLIGSDAEAPGATPVRDVVATGRFAYRPWWDWSQSDDDGAAADAALARVGLADCGERPFETLSSGERQRAWLALALAQDARLVLLDEPTSHLDPRYALEMLCLIRGIARDATTAFVVLHDLNEAATVADRVAVVGDGRLLAFAAPNEALHPDVLEHAFGIAFERIDIGSGAHVFPRGYRATSRLLE